ncbi:MAG: nicotinate-nucleotide--dimethylbenzimidazole phosphoribosyltransferase, partial [Micromonosporaceae bacterium]
MTLADSLDVPLPDDAARTEAIQRLARLDLPGAGFGVLADPIGWAAGVQARANPTSFQAVRVVLLAGDHHGNVAAGADPDSSRHRAERELAGTGPLTRLATQAGASLELVDAGLAGT